MRHALLGPRIAQADYLANGARRILSSDRETKPDSREPRLHRGPLRLAPAHLLFLGTGTDTA